MKKNLDHVIDYLESDASKSFMKESVEYLCHVTVKDPSGLCYLETYIFVWDYLTNT